MRATNPQASNCHTLIIVPTYNERQNLTELVRRIRENTLRVHLLIVDDASPDGTADYAESLFEDFHGGSVLRRTGPRGLGLSYVDGYSRALEDGYERVIQMDADLSHDPAYIPELIYKLSWQMSWSVPGISPAVAWRTGHSTD